MAFTVIPACRLAELPEAALFIEGFRGLVTSSTTPIATGRSDRCQAGLIPAENPHLFTTHVKDHLRPLNNAAEAPVHRRTTR